MARRPVSTLHRVIEVAVSQGVSASKLAELRGEEAWLELPVADRVGRAEAVWREIAAALPGRAFALAYARAIDPDDFGLLGLAVRTAPTLRQALDRVARYAQLFTPEPPWAWRPLGDCAGVGFELRARLSADGGLHELLAVTWIAELYAVMSKMLAARPEVRAVHLPAVPPGPLSEYVEFFGCTPSIGGDWSGFEFDHHLLERPSSRADAGVSSFLVEQLEALAAEDAAKKRPALDERLRPMIAKAFADGGAPSMATVARRLAMSERTLRRRLEDAGRRWTDLVDEVRRQLAFSLLSQDDASMAEVAFMLGYSEPSAFFRAFRRWTGETPTTWRESRQAMP